MDYIYNTLVKSNKDCNFCDKIEKSDNSDLNYISNYITYRNFLFCILDNFDLILSSSNDKNIDFPKRVSEICSQIEEDKINYYDKFNYNKRFSIKKIQNSLQVCSNKEKLLSTIFYLNDYYSTHFVIVYIVNGEYIETTTKNYPKKYLECDNKFYKLTSKKYFLKTNKINYYFSYKIVCN